MSAAVAAGSRPSARSQQLQPEHTRPRAGHLPGLPLAAPSRSPASPGCPHSVYRRFAGLWDVALAEHGQSSETLGGPGVLHPSAVRGVLKVVVGG